MVLILYGTDLLNATMLAKKLGIGTTTLYKMMKKTNSRGEHCPVHQLAPGCRKYYVLDEVKSWLLG